jgi:hypothetical protein
VWKLYERSFSPEKKINIDVFHLKINQFAVCRQHADKRSASQKLLIKKEYGVSRFAE